MHNLKQIETFTEPDVISKVIEGETELFEILIRKNNPLLYKTGRAYGFNHHDTEDLMQDAFIAAYANLKNFQQRSSFKTWLVQIMLNLCYRKTHQLSFKNERPTSTIYKEKTEPLFSSGQNKEPYQAAVGRELIQVIESALIDLPLSYRMVFSLRELNGMSTLETAQALGITETNVKVRLNRARRLLRGKIEKLYSIQDIFDFNLIYCDSITYRVLRATTGYSVV